MDIEERLTKIEQLIETPPNFIGLTKTQTDEVLKELVKLCREMAAKIENLRLDLNDL